MDAAGLFLELVFEDKARVSIVQEKVKSLRDPLFSQVWIANPKVLPRP